MYIEQIYNASKNGDLTKLTALFDVVNKEQLNNLKNLLNKTYLQIYLLKNLVSDYLYKTCALVLLSVESFVVFFVWNEALGYVIHINYKPKQLPQLKNICADITHHM